MFKLILSASNNGRKVFFDREISVFALRPEKRAGLLSAKNAVVTLQNLFRIAR